MKLNRLRQHTFWNSFASNIAGPFVGFNVTSSGAAAILVGYVSAIGTLASAVTQLVGGRMVDRSGRRVATAALFSTVTGLLWMGASFYQEPTFLAVAFTAITLAAGFYAAGYTAILGEASEEKGRGRFLGSFAQLTSAGALVALVLTTALTAFYQSYSLLYFLSGALFLVSAFFLRGQGEQEVRGPAELESAKRIRQFYALTAVYGLFWGFAWPLFTITLVKVVNMDLFQYSLSQAIAVGATVAFQPLVGRLVDRDRAGAVFWGRMGLVIYPLVYMAFGAAWEVYLVNIVSGVTNALLNIAFVAYLYDISPAGRRGRYNAEFNMVTGVTTMAGSLAAGVALSAISTPDTLWVSLAYLYVIAAVGRGAAALLTLKVLRGTARVPGAEGSLVAGGKLK